MPQPAKQASPKWTQNHESALSGLVGLGISKKQAKEFLEAQPSGEVDELMRQALAARTRSQAPPSAIPGAPSGAVPLHPPKSAPAPSQAAPPKAPGMPFPEERGPWSAASMAAGQKPQRVRVAPQSGPQISGEWSASSMMPSAPRQGTPAAAINPAMPPPAPITPAAAQTQPGPQAVPPVKPRIRIRAAGQRIPPAPIGPAGGAESTPEAPAQAKEQAAPLPLIRSKEEYDQLPPGTEFIWRSDGHVYEKPAERGSAVEEVQ